MHVSAVAALMIITTVLLSACEQQQVASIEDKSTYYYGRDVASRMAAGFGPTMQATAAQVDTVTTASLQPPEMQNSIRIISYQETATNTVAPVAANHPPATLPAPVATSWSWPVNGEVTVPYGKQANGIANEGVTIAAAEGTPIRAAADGQIAYVGSEVRDYGNMVIVRHSGGQMTSYAHARNISVDTGMQVKQGDVIGYVGKSGSAKSPQLHFAMRDGSTAIDPMSKLPSQMASR